MPNTIWRRAWDVKYQLLSLLLLIAVIVEGGLLIATHNARPRAAAGLSSPPPPDIPLPPHSTLTRTENLLSEGSQNWYYSVADSSEATIVAFYHQSLKAGAWTCVSATASTNIQRQGQPVSGTGVYITALRNGVKVELDSGSLDYGSSILNDRLDSGAVALRITLEPAKGAGCAAG